jgi:hypothetical protein
LARLAALSVPSVASPVQNLLLAHFAFVRPSRDDLGIPVRSRRLKCLLRVCSLPSLLAMMARGRVVKIVHE